MSLFYKFMFPSKMNGVPVSIFLLLMRVLFGGLLLWHGVEKMMNFEALSQTFPDPLGIGSSLSLRLAVFGEVFCSLGFIFGFLYRLSVLPMIFTMFIAFFVIHSGDAFAVKELAFVYLMVYLIMYIVGPGRYSLDTLLVKSLKKRG